MALYKRTYSDQELLTIASEVVAVASPDGQGKVSQAQYDAARARSEYPDSPQAKYIAKRLKLPWVRVVKQARDGNFRKSRRFPSEFIPAVTVEYALQLIAGRLEVQSMNAGQYETERRKLLSGARNEDELYALEEAVPSAERLQATVGSWDDICKQAGLKAPGRTAQRRVGVKQNAYTVSDCRAAVAQALKWADGRGQQQLTTRLYDDFARTREVPSRNTINRTLKRDLGDGHTLSSLIKEMQASRLKRKTRPS